MMLQPHRMQKNSVPRQKRSLKNSHKPKPPLKTAIQKNRNFAIAFKNFQKKPTLKPIVGERRKSHTRNYGNP